MTGWARSRPSAHWVDYPDTTYGTVGSAEFGNWDDGLERLKSLYLDPRDYGAIGDGTTDDSTALQAAIDAATAIGAASGQMVVVSGASKQYLVGTTLTWKSYVLLENAYLKLKAGTNADLVQSLSFGTLTGGTSNAGITRWGFRNVTLDGNGSAQSGTSYPLRTYGYDFVIDGLEILNGLSGGWYSEWGTGNGPSGPMEARVQNLRLHNNQGTAQLNWNGPHDTQFGRVFVEIDTGFSATNGILTGGHAGAEVFNVLHVWGLHHTNGVNLGHSAIIRAGILEGASAINLLVGAGVRVNFEGQIFGSASGSNQVGLQMTQGATDCVINAQWYGFTAANGDFPIKLAGSGTGGKNVFLGEINDFGANLPVTGTQSATDTANVVNTDSTQNSYVNSPAPIILQSNNGNLLIIRKPVATGIRFNFNTTASTPEFDIRNGSRVAWYSDDQTTLVAHIDSADGSAAFKGVQRGLTALTYSASITPNAKTGDWQNITATNSTAFTINAPTNPPDSTHTQDLTVEIVNSSGGAMGAITWNTAFVLVGGAFTNPASTKKRWIRFSWNGASWIEISRASADYS